MSLGPTYTDHVADVRRRRNSHDYHIGLNYAIDSNPYVCALALSNVFLCVSLLFTQLIAQSTIVEYMPTYVCLVAQDWITSTYKYITVLL